MKGGCGADGCREVIGLIKSLAFFVSGFADTPPDLFPGSYCRQAAHDTMDGGAPIQRAVLNFAHAETVVPYTSLLQMFGSPGECQLPQVDHCFTL